MTELMDKKSYVRQRWGRINTGLDVDHKRWYSIVYEDGPHHDKLLMVGSLSEICAFTVERERQITEIEEEIKQVYLFPADPLIQNRILTRLQSALAELRRGMKGNSNV